MSGSLVSHLSADDLGGLVSAWKTRNEPGGMQYLALVIGHARVKAAARRAEIEISAMIEGAGDDPNRIGMLRDAAQLIMDIL